MIQTLISALFHPDEMINKSSFNPKPFNSEFPLKDSHIFPRNINLLLHFKAATEEFCDNILRQSLPNSIVQLSLVLYCHSVLVFHSEVLLVRHDHVIWLHKVILLHDSVTLRVMIIVLIFFIFLFLLIISFWQVLLVYVVLLVFEFLPIFIKVVLFHHRSHISVDIRELVGSIS